jgi:hypothetical protein
LGVAIHQGVSFPGKGRVFNPDSAYADWSDFKIYLNDVGLLASLAGVSLNSILLENDFFEEFKGVIAEQFICQQIKSQSIHLPMLLKNNLG